MLLLLLVGALALVLAGDANVADEHAPAPPMANSNAGSETVQPGIYEGPDTSIAPAILRVPTYVTILGRLSSDNWSIGP